LADCKWENGHWVGTCTSGERLKIVGSNILAGMSRAAGRGGCEDAGPGCPTGALLGFAGFLVPDGPAIAGAGAARSVESLVTTAGEGEGNFGMGAATAEDANAAGKAWVGDGARTASDGKTLISKDGLRQYRPPSYKPKLGKTQANFESRTQPSGSWTNNGHLDVVPTSSTS